MQAKELLFEFFKTNSEKELQNTLQVIESK